MIGRKTVRLCISGRVQGVWYRGWMVDRARTLGLHGWVRNRTDGTVEALVAGPESDVAALVAAAHDGPRAARVDGVAVEPEPTDYDGPADFSQMPTVWAVPAGPQAGSNASSQASRSAMSTSSMPTGRPKSTSDVTPCSAMPQGTMPS